MSEPNLYWLEHPGLIVPGWEAIPVLGPTLLLPMPDFEHDLGDTDIVELHDTKGILAYDDYHCASHDCACGCVFLEIWKGGHALLSGCDPDIVVYVVGELATQQLRFGAGVIPTREAELVRAELEAALWPESWELLSDRRQQVRSSFGASPRRIEH